MKKLLLGSAAIAGLVLASAPAQAQMELTIGGHSKNYVGYLDQDTVAGGAEERNFDMQRETELHFNGESTLDNGLTFGFQVEAEVDAGDAGNTIEESYIYLSGTWGRINAGSENGAAYLLQVAAPSADSNIDGIRQYINPVIYAVAPTGSTGWASGVPAGQGSADGFDYDNDLTGVSEKLTYLSPNWNGFQVGASYTFDTADAGSVTPVTTGFNTDSVTAPVATGDAWEVAARYEGVMSNFGYALGGGYTAINAEAPAAGTDDAEEWNVGLDVDAGPFGIGAIYTEGDSGAATRESVETWVVGVDYTTGPFKFGASYLDQNDETAGAADLESQRWTGGVIYTAGPGLSFRGSISNIDHEMGATNGDATSVMGGVQINF